MSMRMVDFVAEQNRLNRTRGLKRTDPGGDIEPCDYPLSAAEAAWFNMSPEEQEKARQEFIRDRKDYILEVWEELGKEQDRWEKECENRRKKN